MATNDYVGKAAFRTIYKRLKDRIDGVVAQIKSWANDRFVQSINGKSGSEITIGKTDIGLSNVDNTADADKRVSHAENADTLDGNHATDFLLKSQHDTYVREVTAILTAIDSRKVDKESGKGLSSNDYTTEEKQKLTGVESGAQKHIAPTGYEVANALGYTPANVADLVDYEVTVTENGASDSTIKSYVFKQKGATIGTINIPKDLVVSSGSVVVGNWVDGVFTEDPSGTGKAIKLVIANQPDPIYINVQDLVDVYTAAKGATEIQLYISSTNEIYATLVKSVRDKIDNAIPKVSGATGKVAQFKSDGSLESSSFEIKKSVPADAVFTDTIIDNEPGEGIDVSGSHGKKISLSSGTMAILSAAVYDHEKLAGIEAGAQVNDPNTVVDASYVHTDNNYTTEDKNSLKAVITDLENVIAEKDALIQDMEQEVMLERKGYSSIPLLCGQPMILMGYGTPREEHVPLNWKQFDPKISNIWNYNQFDDEIGDGYNWNGTPSAIGQIYIDASDSADKRIYIATTIYNAGDLVWK